MKTRADNLQRTVPHQNSLVGRRSRMMFRLVVTLISAVIFDGCATRTNGENREIRLSLPYWQFDQTPAGWRALADRREFRKAAILIEAYLPRHRELAPNERAMLHFHAAQLFGFVGDDSLALRHLIHAEVPEGSPGFPTRWNDYVAATNAFLKHEHADLLAARERMARGSITEQDRTYLGTVDLLISRYGESYGAAYLSQMESHK